MKETIMLAYLDPGAGSLVLQLLVGGFLGSMLLLKVFWRRMVRFFKGSKVEEENKDKQDGLTPPSQ